MPADRHVRAKFSAETIVVYQAYASLIADAALAAGTFVTPFKRERMTWIKPSFLWMMYRSGWATKPGQERITDVTRTAAEVRRLLADGGRDAAEEALPGERVYPLPESLRDRIGASWR
jgi:hypothetical protein